MKPLPDNDDKFWKVGDYKPKNQSHTPIQRSCLRNHEFIQVGSNAECRLCKVGFPLGASGTVQDGHIYIAGTEVA